MIRRVNQRIEVAAEINRFITESLKQRTIFEDAKSFRYLTRSLQIKKILGSEEDAEKLKDEARVY